MNIFDKLLNPEAIQPHNKLQLIEHKGCYNQELNIYSRIKLNDGRCSFKTVDGIFSPNLLVENCDKEVTDIIQAKFKETDSQLIKSLKLFFNYLYDRYTPITVESTYIYLWENGISLATSLSIYQVICNWLIQLRKFNNTLIVDVDYEFDSLEIVKDTYNTYEHFKTEYNELYQKIKSIDFGYIPIELIPMNYNKEDLPLINTKLNSLKVFDVNNICTLLSII